MQELKEILRVLRSSYLEKEEVMTDNNDVSMTLQKKLIDGISSGIYISDQQAASEIYGKFYDKHTFEILKSKVKHRALTTLLLQGIKNPERNPREAANHHLKKQLVEINLLLQFGARSIAVKLLRKFLATSQRFLLTEMMLSGMVLLKSHYWYIGDKKKYKKTSVEVSRLLRILSLEQLSETIYQLSTIEFAQSRANGSSSKKYKQAVKGMNRFKKLIRHSYVIRVNYHKFRIFACQMKGDQEKVIIECEKALQFFGKNADFRSTALTIYLQLNRIEAFYFTANHEMVLSTAAVLRNLLPQKSPEHLTIDRFTFIAKMYLNNYEDAHSIALEVLNNWSTIDKNEDRFNEWTLFLCYSALGKFMKNSSQKREPEILHTLRFPPASKDKKGINISLLICEVVYSLLMRDHPKILKLDKKMDNYLDRHLKNRIDTRANLMLKLLRLIIKVDFDMIKIEKKAGQYLDALRENSSRDLVEIIPYEILWELLIKTLNSREIVRREIN